MHVYIGGIELAETQRPDEPPMIEVILDVGRIEELYVQNERCFHCNELISQEERTCCRKEKRFFFPMAKTQFISHHQTRPKKVR